MSKDTERNEFDEYRAALQSRVVKLSRPVPAHGRTFSEITIREPTLEDLERTELTGLQNPAVILRQVLASCAGLPPSSVKRLPVRDVLACNEALADMGFTVSELYGLLGVANPATPSASDESSTSSGESTSSPVSTASAGGPTG